MAVLTILLCGGGAWGYAAFGHMATMPQGSDAGAAVASAFPATDTPVVPPLGSEVVITPSGKRVDPAALDADVPPPDGSVQYRNEKYGFSFYHAPDAVIREYDEGGGAETVVLENFEIGRGMQVFIVPYAGDTISEARFKEDVPSGVRTDVENTSIDGTKAVTFASTDAMLGDTREIWFLHKGYLFEVTTISGTAGWLTPVIQSWKFL